MSWNNFPWPFSLGKWQRNWNWNQHFYCQTFDLHWSDILSGNFPEREFHPTVLQSTGRAEVRRITTNFYSSWPRLPTNFCRCWATGIYAPLPPPEGAYSPLTSARRRHSSLTFHWLSTKLIRASPVDLLPRNSSISRNTTKSICRKLEQVTSKFQRRHAVRTSYVCCAEGYHLPVIFCSLHMQDITFELQSLVVEKDHHLCGADSGFTCIDWV